MVAAAPRDRCFWLSIGGRSTRPAQKVQKVAPHFLPAQHLFSSEAMTHRLPPALPPPRDGKQDFCFSKFSSPSSGLRVEIPKKAVISRPLGLLT